MDPSQVKKKLNKTNPRRSPDRAGKQTAGNTGVDKTTVILSATAVILLILVVLFLNRSFVDAVFPGSSSKMATNNSVPLIERIENEDTPAKTEEPLVNLGVPEEPEASAAEKLPPENTEAAPPGNTTARLFFIRVSDEGKISIKSVLRAVPSNGSPLTMAIRALLEGPRPNELSNDVLSLIPEDSDLIGARIQDGVAFLDFNEQFRFNALGIEGYKSQVEQIVYTATEFPTVQKVQFLIDGQRIEYLGGEGFWVGGPLGREDF